MLYALSFFFSLLTSSVSTRFHGGLSQTLRCTYQNLAVAEICAFKSGGTEGSLFIDAMTGGVGYAGKETGLLNVQLPYTEYALSFLPILRSNGL